MWLLVALHVLSAWSGSSTRDITTNNRTHRGAVSTIITRDSVAVVMTKDGSPHHYVRFAHDQIRPAVGGYSARNGQWFAKWDSHWVGLIHYDLNGKADTVTYATPR